MERENFEENTIEYTPEPKNETKKLKKQKKLDKIKEEAPEKKLSPREEKIESFYKRIDEKINIISEIRKFVEENINSEDFFIKFQEKLNNLISDSTEINPKKITELMRLDKKRADLNEHLNKIKIEFENLSQKEREKKEREYEKKSAKIAEINIKINKIEAQDTDSKFIKELINFLKKIIYCKDTAAFYENEYKANPQNFLKEVKHNSGYDLTKLNNEDLQIEFSGYSVNFILQPEKYDEIIKIEGSEGFHLYGTIFNFIKKNENLKKTKKHENIHTLTTHLPFEPMLDEKNIEQVIKKGIDEFYFKNNEPNSENKKIFIKEIEKILNVLIENKYTNRTELLADIDSIKNIEISTYALEILELMDLIQSLKDETLSKFLEHEIEDKEIITIFENSQKKIEDKFLEYLTKLSNIFFISDKMGNEEKAGLILILFPLDQINKIIKYFEHCYGKEKYNFYRIIQSLILKENYFKNLEKSGNRNFLIKKEAIYKKIKGRKYTLPPSDLLLNKYIKNNELSSFFKFSNLEELNNLLENNDFFLSENEKQEIADNLKDNSKHFANEELMDLINSNNLDKILEEIKLIRQIGEKLKIKEFEIMVEKIGIWFLAWNFNNLTKGGERINKIIKIIPSVQDLAKKFGLL